MLKTIGYVTGGIVALGVLSVGMFGLNFAGIHINGVLRTEQAKVDRQVIEHTPSFVRGMNSEFGSMLHDYRMSGNAAVCAGIKQRFQTYRDVLEPQNQTEFDRLTCVPTLQ